jgi:hypothetical protein
MTIQSFDCLELMWLQRQVGSRIRPRCSTTPHGPNKSRIFEDEAKEIEELRGIYSLRLVASSKASPIVVKEEVNSKPALQDKTSHADACHNCSRRQDAAAAGLHF